MKRGRTAGRLCVKRAGCWLSEREAGNVGMKRPKGHPIHPPFKEPARAGGTESGRKREIRNRVKHNLLDSTWGSVYSSDAGRQRRVLPAVRSSVEIFTC